MNPSTSKQWQQMVWRWLQLGVDPAQSGAVRRRQYITNAVPALVLLMVLFYFLLFFWLGNWALASISLKASAIPLLGMVWFYRQQRLGRPPHYWKACLICQATVLAGILGGQGTEIGGHYYFLLFFLTTPLVVPTRDKWGMLLVTSICIGWFSLFDLHPWPASAEVAALGVDTIKLLYLSVLLSGSVILFVALLSGEFFSEALERRIQQMACTDVLTGLANRRVFYQTMAQWQLACQRERRPFCLAMLDIDHFKRINDSHGHEAGDQVLRALARLLQQGVGRDDLVCRMGGEEFAILLAGRSLEQALPLCEALRQTIAATPMLTGSELLHVTVSMGLGQWHGVGGESGFLAAVDQALYAAKHAGRNAIRLHVDGAMVAGLPRQETRMRDYRPSADSEG
ncbi:GGDEF domain-containing protein [Aquitalea sp. USM4]|uniref:GGDEF domain-containing protein n=1 Tax=Aquitalea sp. USM4 TaxID=1590041 RepID=UPI0013F14D90|nr:GGDEF domain-containing protein [Aquitalea sp. USM4]